MTDQSLPPAKDVEREMCSCGFPQSYPIPHEHDQTEREKQIIKHYVSLRPAPSVEEILDKLCEDCFAHQKNHQCDQKDKVGCYGYLAQEIAKLGRE